MEGQKERFCDSYKRGVLEEWKSEGQADACKDWLEGTVSQQSW